MLIHTDAKPRESEGIHVPCIGYIFYYFTNKIAPYIVSLYNYTVNNMHIRQKCFSPWLYKTTVACTYSNCMVTCASKIRIQEEA